MQQKSLRDVHKLVAGDYMEDFWVGIRGVSWLSHAERKPQQSLGCARGAWSQHRPSPPGRTEIAESVVRKRAHVSKPIPPTRTERHSGAADSEAHKGAQVTPPPTRTDRDSRVAVSRVGGA